MNSPGHDIAVHLAANGVGTFNPSSASSTIFVGTEPAKPDDCVTIYDTGGAEPDTVELDWFRPTFQVRVRDGSYVDAYNKQVTIRELLILSEIQFSGGRFVGVMMSSEIMSLGLDENKRYVLVANYRAIREES